jgi:hypothetical protein
VTPLEQFDDSCLGALYKQKFGAVKDLCKFKVVPMKEQVYQVKKGLFLVYAPKARNADMVCRNGSHSELHLAKGTQQLWIPPGCQAFFANHLATSDFSIKLDSEIVHFKWDWDPLSLLPAREIEEMAQTLKNLSSMNLQQPNLADLRYATKIKEAEHNSEFGFNQLDLGLSHLGSKLFGGLTMLGAGFSTIILIAGAVFIYCHCHRKSSPVYTGYGFLAHPINPPQAAPAQLVYQPPSDSTYQVPSHSGSCNIYHYIQPRRWQRRRPRSRMCCGSRSSEDEEVAYAANSEELTYMTGQSTTRNQAPRSTRTSKTYALPVKAHAATSSAPSYGDLQSRLNTLAAA